MSTINANIADYFTQIETLTNTNLQILKALNDAFYSKQNHIFAEVDNATYALPSFLSLENKINMLQENFQNLVKSPETGEAYFNFDGNTRAIEVRKYSFAPNSIKLNAIDKFYTEDNDIFKDFMTPMPYVNIGLQNIPNDITEVNVKKIIPISDSLKQIFGTLFNDPNDPNIASLEKTHSEIARLIENYVEDVDYTEYDTIYRLPIHKNIGSATYVIESVISDAIDDDLNEIITLKLRNNLKDQLYTNNLTYKLFDELIEKPLHVGDELINYDGTGKVVIQEVRTSSNTLVVKVVNGEYLNFIGTTSYDTNDDTDIHDLSKLRFYSAVDFNEDKYIKIPLEEDEYVFIAVAPLNSRMNVQSSWGTGLLINADKLIDNDSNSFRKYYDDNVKNIGDVLFEMTSMVTSPISKLSNDELSEYINYTPNIPDDAFKVLHINSHLDNSDTVINIRNAYAQKRQAEIDLENVQNNISQINSQLSSISFADTSGIRDMYTAQLTSLNEQKNNLLSDINIATEIISTSVNTSDVPIENAKYRIRGFYIPENSEKVIGINVQYRYKNISTDISVPTTIKGSDGSDCVFSDWIELKTRNKRKLVSYNGTKYTYEYEDVSYNANEPTFNQIDIPISQGESVDIRLKLIYDLGQPFVTVESNWSNVINIPFPSDFAKSTPILTIIEENNNDIESNRFNSILSSNGTISHISDMIIDQNITYFHKPEYISSGFYTPERRIIPLKDKLDSLSNDISLLKTEILGGEGGLLVNIGVGDDISQMYTDRLNTITLKDYASISEEIKDTGEIDGSYVSNIVDDSIKSIATYVNIYVSNTGSNTLKLYPLFPGPRDTKLNKLDKEYKFKLSDYCDNDKGDDGEKYYGVFFAYDEINESTESTSNSLQSCNQFITFRIKDTWTGEMYYGDNDNNLLDYTKLPSIGENDNGLILYPHVSTKYGLCIDSDENRSCLIIKPGEEIVIPIYCEFKHTNESKTYKKTMSFDLRTSLYNDPINYTFTVISKHSNTTNDKLSISNKNRLLNRLKNLSKYNTTVK